MAFPKARRYPRLRVDDGIQVECIEEGRAYRTLAHDLGGGGLFINTPKPIAPGHKLKVQFRPARGLRMVEAEARVRHQLEGAGNGVEFISIRPEGRREILKVILRDLRAGAPRSSLNFVAQVTYEREMFLGFSTRWGEDGLLIETKKALAPGSRVVVRFRAKDDEPLTVAGGEVVSTVENLGIAVRISPLDEPFGRQ
jgi:PilZ domain